MRLADVARVAGVSSATASRVFSGTATVDPELAARVLEAGERLGYQRDGAAQMTASGRNTLVGVVTDQPRSARFAEIFAGLVDVAETRGLTVVSGTSHDPESLISAGQSIAGFRPRAIVVVARRDVLEVMESHPLLRRVARTIPTVAIGRSAKPLRAHVVETGDEAGARALAHAVAHRGYRHAVVLGVGDAYPAEALRTAVLAEEVQAWAESTSVVVASEPSRDEAFAHIRAMLDGVARPELILAVSDELAMGAMAALREHGLVPGSDVAVTGFDDLPLARDLVPGLTTVRTDLAGAGRRALELALDGSAPGVTTLRAQVVVRESARAAD